MKIDIKEINSTSMKGNLIVTSWKNNQIAAKNAYKTTLAQDKLVKSFINNKINLFEETELTRSNSDFIQKLFELFTGKTFNNTGTKKIIYNYGDEVYIADRGARFVDGVEFDYSFK